MLRASLKEAISDYSANIIGALIKAECEAATAQCNQGPESGSNIFSDGIVGEDMVHAGLYIILIRDCLDRIAKANDHAENFIDESRRCLSVLKDVAPVVIPLMLHQSPEASAHVDPRPSIAEAWFLTIESLVAVCRSHELAAPLASNGVESFLGESLSVATLIIYLKDLGTKKVPAPAIQKGMSLDGPQTLAIESFVSASLLLGPNILLAAGQSIKSVIQVDNATSEDNFGLILIAGLLRGVSGAQPPWAVEETPTLFQSIYVALGNDCDQFVQTLSASTKVTASLPFGGVRAGELLAGRFLNVSNRHIESLLSKSKELCIKGMCLI